jgi:Tol biopolymer transport system component
MVGGNSHVFVMDADGTHVQQLTDDGHFNVQPAWSPDGRWLVYASYRHPDMPVGADDDLTAGMTAKVNTENWVLAKVPGAGGSIVTLTDPKDSPTFAPVFSPDGRSIAYISAGTSKQADIYLVDADGRNPRRVNETLLTREESLDWR